ncbi:protein-L-isoaspartate(D-aspartate) O-methyltransferase, partial [Streptomyces sp. 2MCAF27]
HEDGTARGRLLSGQISFMLARPQLPPLLGTLPNLDDGQERAAALAPDVLDDWNTRFVAQLAVPGAQRFTLTWGGRKTHVLLNVDAGAWAALAQDGGTWTVRQGGPERLWDAVEDKVARWRTDGSPPLERFEVIVTPEKQAVTWAKV